jgi:hypothetical protein
LLLEFSFGLCRFLRILRFEGIDEQTQLLVPILPDALGLKFRPGIGCLALQEDLFGT